MMCLTRVVVYPGPNAVIRSRGRMTFALPHGTIVLRATIVQRFRADGVRARQSATGTLVRGFSRYKGARGNAERRRARA